jgi:NodT family efflux transporter outer membrane factor (OMF) lipoprotein
MLAALLLAGCSAGTGSGPPPTEIPAAFRITPATTAAAWPVGDWWTGFRSPELDRLIDAARRQNFDIAAAIGRVRQADAQLRIAGAALLPSLDATAGASWQHAGFGTGSTGRRFAGGTASADYHNYNFGLNAAYDLDFWGRNQALRQAALRSALFSRFDQQTVALTVLVDVANAWFTALSLADRLAVAQRNLAAAEDTLGVIRGRFAAGTTDALQVSQQQALVDAERAVVPNLRNQMEQALIGLGLLTGRPPEAIAVRPGSLTDLALPPVAPGLPSELLRRRPDVAAAEAQLAAQHLNVQAARAAFYPSVQLTGSAGYAGPALAGLLSPGGALASLAAGLTAPIFDGGTLRGQLEQARGREAELLADYRKAVVQAFTDVDQALAAWQFTSQQQALQQTAVASAQRAAAIARAQMAAGTVDVTTVLTTETTLLTQEDTLAQVRLARIQALLSLYKALGGGWLIDATPRPALSPGPVPGGVALPIRPGN